MEDCPQKLKVIRTQHGLCTGCVLKGDQFIHLKMISSIDDRTFTAEYFGNNIVKKYMYN